MYDLLRWCISAVLSQIFVVTRSPQQPLQLDITGYKRIFARISYNICHIFLMQDLYEGPHWTKLWKIFCVTKKLKLWNANWKLDEIVQKRKFSKRKHILKNLKLKNEKSFLKITNLHSENLIRMFDSHHPNVFSGCASKYWSILDFLPVTLSPIVV